MQTWREHYTYNLLGFLQRFSTQNWNHIEYFIYINKDKYQYVQHVIGKTKLLSFNKKMMRQQYFSKCEAVIYVVSKRYILLIRSP